MRLARFGAGSTKVWIATAFIAGGVPACVATAFDQASCKANDRSISILEAQAVPSATFIPCILPLPVGWSYGGSEVRTGIVRIWLNSDRAGTHAAEATLTTTCNVSRARPALPDGASGLKRYDDPEALHPRASISYFVFAGGCVTYRFSFTHRTAPALFAEADHALGFTPRSVFVNGVREDAGLTLCGAGAPTCPG